MYSQNIKELITPGKQGRGGATWEQDGGDLGR